MLEYFMTLLGKSSFVFQIEVQDERITKYIKSVKVFHASNGWSVCRDNEPGIDLTHKLIYLQGRDHDLDSKVERYWNLNGKEAKEIKKQVDKALYELVDAAKNWKKRTTVEFVPFITVREDICVSLNQFVRASQPRIIILR